MADARELLSWDTLHGFISPSPIKYAKVDAAAASTTAVVAAVSGKKLRILSYTVSANSSTVAAKFVNSVTTGTAITQNLTYSTTPLTWTALESSVESIAGEGISMTIAGAVGVRGFLTYVEI